MDVLRRRKEILTLPLPDEIEREERPQQVALLGMGAVVYFGFHRTISGYIPNRPIVPQFFAVVPAAAVVYAGGLLMRYRSLQRASLMPHDDQ